jgi:hypothetical protein
MKIVSKEIKEDGSKSIVYLIDDNDKPLIASIVNSNEKSKLINDLLATHFTPEDWVNNKEDLLNNVVEMTYNEYINQ